MSIQQKVNEIAKNKNMDLPQFCSWLLKQRKNHDDVFKTIDGITFKSTGVCRYYNFHAKFEGESDDKLVYIHMFAD